MTVNTEPQNAMAVPQANGNDTLTFLRLLSDNPIVKVPGPQANETTIFGGKVAIRFSTVPDVKLEDAPADHHHIYKAEALLLQCWPEIYTQFGHIINEFHPKYMPDNTGDGAFGSMSHQPANVYGSMWATVNDRICLSQAFVHEMAHNKLFAIGLQFADAAPLFLNSNEELFDSPIRVDIPRPISAIFHGFYAFTHVLALDRKILEHAGLDKEEEDYVIGLINKNANRVRIGMDTVSKCARLTPFGEKFVNDTIDWAKEELRLSEKYIKKIRQGQQLLIVGPTGAGKTTFSKTLSKKTGVGFIPLDLICWEYWYQTPLLQNCFLRSVGEQKLALWNKTLKQEQKKELFKELVNKKVIDQDTMDRLKYQLLFFAIEKFKGQIIDTGSGHVVFKNDKYLKLLKTLLLQNDIRVVQLRPLAHVEQATSILDGRIKYRGYTDEEVDRAKKNMLNPSYRTLSDHVIDSNDPVETCISTFFELTEITPVLEAN